MRSGTPEPFIAADVGGTFARVGLVENADPANLALSLHQYKTYRCADYPGLGAILRDFLASLGGVPVRRGAIASAGYPLGDELIHTNLPWPVVIPEIRNELGFRDLSLINDFAAIAYAVRHVRDEDMTLLSRAARPASDGPVVVLGPGTGLGAAVLIPGEPAGTVLTTEAGQAAFAATTEREVQIVAVLRRQFEHVSIERVLSGPGLVNVYGAICNLQGAAAMHRAPEDVTAAALEGRDALAREALEVFCGLMGSVAGDLALYYGAHGGVFLAGGILPRIKQFLLDSTFPERFLRKGRLGALLERVPVKLIEHGQLGVLGAASWYLDAQRTTDEGRTA
jgi:glucokinase